jgi:hypothetical protein
MLRLSIGLLVLAVVDTGPVRSPSAAAWPHRAIVTGVHGRRATFRAYTLGGELVIAANARGQATGTPAAIPSLRVLTAMDTIRAETPADFPLDLTKGPVVFVADGNDSLHVVVGRNPYGSIVHVAADGRKLTVRLVRGSFVIDRR